MKSKKTLLVLPLALALMAGSALVVRAADGEVHALPCADITAGEAAYSAPTEVLPGRAESRVPGTLSFLETLAGPSCLDVQYGLVVLKANPQGGAPTVLASEVVPGDGVSNELNFSLELTSDPAQKSVCLYLYTLGASGESSTSTPETGNPHGQTISGGSTGLLDRAPDGTTVASYCNLEGDGGGSRGYN